MTAQLSRQNTIYPYIFLQGDDNQVGKKRKQAGLIPLDETIKLFKRLLGPMVSGYKSGARDDAASNSSVLKHKSMKHLLGTASSEAFSES